MIDGSRPDSSRRRGLSDNYRSVRQRPSVINRSGHNDDLPVYIEIHFGFKDFIQDTSRNAHCGSSISIFKGKRGTSSDSTSMIDQTDSSLSDPSARPLNHVTPSSGPFAMSISPASIFSLFPGPNM